jgi:hypothetical protein
MRVFMVVAAALLFAACGNTMLCASSNCTGCCESAQGRCLSGTDVAFCGVGGATCKVCKTGEVCTGTGACQNRTQACSPNTCTGCCDDQGRCVAGQLASACGESGVSCTVCLATQQCFPTTSGAMGGRCQ